MVDQKRPRDLGTCVRRRFLRYRQRLGQIPRHDVADDFASFRSFVLRKELCSIATPPFPEQNSGMSNRLIGFCVPFLIKRNILCAIYSRICYRGPIDFELKQKERGPFQYLQIHSPKANNVTSSFDAIKALCKPPDGDEVHSDRGHFFTEIGGFSAVFDPEVVSTCLLSTAFDRNWIVSSALQDSKLWWKASSSFSDIQPVAGNMATEVLPSSAWLSAWGRGRDILFQRWM